LDDDVTAPPLRPRPTRRDDQSPPDSPGLQSLFPERRPVFILLPPPLDLQVPSPGDLFEERPRPPEHLVRLAHRNQVRHQLTAVHLDRGPPQRDKPPGELI